MHYNAAGKLDSTQATDGTTTTSTYASTGARKLDHVLTGQGIKTGFDYDGPLLRQIRTRGEGDDPQQDTTVSIGYDNSARPVSETVNGQSVATQYNNDDQVTQVGDVAINHEPATGDPTSVVAGRARSQLTVDTRGKLAAQASAVTSEGSPDTPVLAESIQRDAVGRITTRIETSGSGSPTTYGYTYDPAGRLLGVTANGSTTESYTYDSTGGLTSRGSGMLTSWIQTDGHGRPVAGANGMAASWSAHY